MQQDGPPLELLVRRLAETPADVLAEPRIRGKGVIDVRALVCDALRDLGGKPPAGAPPEERNLLRCTALACWLLREPWFLGREELAPRAEALLGGGLRAFAKLVAAKMAVEDPDRREELARLCLKALGLRPAGETAAQAADRLATLDSAERERVLAETRAAEKRAAEVREAMLRQQAQEAAVRYGGE